ncbi:hypothetical protein ACGF1Z_00900 [Streptomyces sp. NPDC048018]|uniref:hypothetical protein n=1 Tax=Streptomyces sp. NPDC048018 TaxID=3365499 RepID=UPI0037243F4E
MKKIITAAMLTLTGIAVATPAHASGIGNVASALPVDTGAVTKTLPVKPEEMRPDGDGLIPVGGTIKNLHAGRP